MPKKDMGGFNGEGRFSRSLKEGPFEYKGPGKVLPQEEQVKIALAQGRAEGHPLLEGEVRCVCGGIKQKGGACPVCKSK